ncbi:MAG: DUF3696 domain-containing protein [Candidatus Poribacteria bacterium]|nr:DUF3696 domain-containing protein [Candidatus Poribacteria bacterium]
MFQSLELENFKAFGERARIPFAPITLIFGENSAGKSTILQVLNLLKQTRASRDVSAPLAPRTENVIVDLGSFQEMIFNHDLKRTLSVRIETKVEHQLAIEFKFKRPSLEEVVLLDQIEIYKGEPLKCIARFQPSGKTVDPEELMGRAQFFYHPFFQSSRGFTPSKINALKCVWITKKTEYWEPEFKWCGENKNELVSWFKEEKSDLEEYIKQQRDEEDADEQKNSNGDFQEDEKNFQIMIESLDANIDFFSSKNFDDIDNYISKRHEEEMKTVLGFQGFLPVITLSHAGFTSIATFLRRRTDEIIFDVNGFAIAAGRALESALEALFPMGPFRKPPERWYIFTGTSPQDVGYRGDLLPDLLFRRPELVENTNEWLKRLEIGYKLDVKSVGAHSGDLFEVRLIDIRRKKPVNVALPDVGFGISQLLPFIVQSLVAKEQIISIEQPEVHVHPRLQADLGDLLAEAIKEPRRNRFIVETHSEHLILRLQRLVRKKQIKPEDVSVIYVSRGSEGAKAQRLHLDEDGDFIDEWPNGFFPERLREL